jgi:hypothetical protein
VKWFTVAAGILLLVSWALLILFFVTRSEAADRASNWVAFPAFGAIGVTMGAVLDRFAARSPVLVSAVTGVALLAVVVNVAVNAALVLRRVTFERIAMPATAALGVVFLWMGAASGFIVGYRGGLPVWLGWFGIATVAYAVGILAFIMRRPEARKGGEPRKVDLIAGAPLLLLLPTWFVCLGLAL